MAEISIVQLMAALVSTIAEIGKPCPEGVLYVAVMGKADYHMFTQGVAALIRAELVKRVPGPMLDLTDRGRELAKQVDGLIAEAKKAKSDITEEIKS